MALRRDIVESLPPSLPAPVTAEPRPELRLVHSAQNSEASMDAEVSGLFLQALASTTAGSLAQSPMRMANAAGELMAGVVAASTAAVARAVGREVDGPVTPGRDARFAAPAWESNAAYWYLRQLHLLRDRFVGQVIEAAPIAPHTKVKATLAASILSDTMAPTNTLLGNPAALQKAFETGGTSLIRGAKNMLTDMATNDGWPSQVDRRPFTVGENTACTPGKVVYRNELFELLQYEPQTEQVHEIPLLFCPPWINKYYIMDLAPERSLVEWAVRHGHTCFAISYRNPDASMRDATFEDYLLDGPLEAIEVVRSITGAEVVNTIAVCLGGTLSAMGMAYDAALGRRTVNSATLINTHTDFTRPGVLGAFADEPTIALLERHMAKEGLLPSQRLSRTFSLCRANDLVFSYLAKNWLMGETPPAFDLLAWNDDGTNMPARMHGDFLRWFYLENRLAEGRMEIDGTRLDLATVDQPTYVVSAVDDHIVPWASAYETTQLLGSEHNRFVLSTSGHIAAIVNPPSPKAKHWTNTDLGGDAEAWKAGAQLNDGTWWDDWVPWIAEQGGALVPAPERLGSDDHPPIGDAPGTYVHG